MSNFLRILVAAMALAASAGATIATDAPPNSLVVTASSLGQSALNDPAAFEFVQSLTTEIGQRLAGTEAHRRAVGWAEARLKAAGFENVHSEPFTFPAWIRGDESAEIVGSVPQHLAVTALGGSVATDANGVEAEIVAEAFRQGDPLACEVLRETADFLAIWAGNVIDLLEPDVFIFGGGVAQLMSGFFGRIREQLANWCVNKRFREMPMVLAKYGSDAGIAGAAALCRL